MSAFSLEKSLERAGTRSAFPARGRRDRGESRFSPLVEQRLAELLQGRDKPKFTEVHRELCSFCDAEGLKAPTRSSIYNAVERVRVPSLAWQALPKAVQTSLYNVSLEDPAELISGDQIVFFAFNYGAPRALSYASGMPWLCLVRADARRGWRPKSHALLRAVMRYRGL